jgi:hypothetical protein
VGTMNELPPFERSLVHILYAQYRVGSYTHGGYLSDLVCLNNTYLIVLCLNLYFKYIMCNIQSTQYKYNI